MKLEKDSVLRTFPLGVWSYHFPMLVWLGPSYPITGEFSWHISRPVITVLSWLQLSWLTIRLDGLRGYFSSCEISLAWGQYLYCKTPLLTHSKQAMLLPSTQSSLKPVNRSYSQNAPFDKMKTRHRFSPFLGVRREFIHKSRHQLQSKCIRSGSGFGAMG